MPTNFNPRPRRCKASSSPKRRAVAVTEMAICLPLIALVIFGSIESCNVIFLKQTLVEAAYQGALAGSRPEATEADILQEVNSVLTAREIAGTSSQVIVAAGCCYDDLSPGENFTVRVQADVLGNIVGPINFNLYPTVDADVLGHKQ